MWYVAEGDSREVLRGLSDGVVDSVVTDPPSGLGLGRFGGKSWDTVSTQHGMKQGRGDRGKRDAFVSGLVPIFRECERVMKPGAFALVWALPRTSHWTATAIEDAGLEVRDVVTHLFADGFPKSRALVEEVEECDCAQVGEGKYGNRHTTDWSSGKRCP